LKVFTPAGNGNAAPASASRHNLTIDESRTQYGWTLTSPNGSYPDGVQRFKTRLLLSSVEPSDKPKVLDETEGYFHIAGFTRSGDWLAYWRAAERSASLQADGLGLYVANSRTGQCSEARVTTLLHEDMIAFSPVKDLIAVTSGGRRETWTNKAVAIIDLSSGKPLVRNLTGASVSAQLATWSPEGGRLAWSEGPDAETLHKQQLLGRSQKTITVIDPGTGVEKQIPFTPKLSLGATDRLVTQSVRSRRIWVADTGRRFAARQLTEDPRYSDEEPRWSRDGSRVLFCRLDVSMDGPAAMTIWLMGKDGSGARQVAGPLLYSSDPGKREKLVYYGYYGYTDWPGMLDWWRET
jgi:dipeptidyl aminopeptidase/acylaminoacyl peptidase